MDDLVIFVINMSSFSLSPSRTNASSQPASLPVLTSLRLFPRLIVLPRRELGSDRFNLVLSHRLPLPCPYHGNNINILATCLLTRPITASSATPNLSSAVPSGCSLHWPVQPMSPLSIVKHVFNEDFFMVSKFPSRTCSSHVRSRPLSSGIVTVPPFLKRPVLKHAHHIPILALLLVSPSAAARSTCSPSTDADIRACLTILRRRIVCR